MTRQESIKKAKKHSFIEETPLALEENGTREFFVFDEGRMISYDLASSKGQPVRLTREELDTAEEFCSEGI